MAATVFSCNEATFKGWWWLVGVGWGWRDEKMCRVRDEGVNGWVKGVKRVERVERGGKVERVEGLKGTR